MHSRRRSFRLLSAALFHFSLGASLAACGHTESYGGSSDVGGSGGSGAGTSFRAYDALSYDLHASFDWSAHKLIASEDIVLLLAEPSVTSVELDSYVDVQRVYAGNVELGFAADTEHGTLRVDLARLQPSNGLVRFTVAYTASLSVALRASSGSDGDPLSARVVYSDSEPDLGSRWLIANHRPADRARFAVDFNLPRNEDLIANGERVQDELGAETRFVRYAMAAPIPSYIMAFAAGELVHEDRATPSVGLSLWHRRGLLLDPNENLDAMADALATFEDRLGPYPWDRYAVVLLPEFSGGMENAGITFNAESSGQFPVRFNLNAHELAHQWFGDWVTVATFDDVWIKEGMATLLAAEAERARHDLEGRGRLFGNHFFFAQEDALRERDLQGRDKYTSGPYGRAAWTLTQIRAAIGEAAFWTSLRNVLHDNALGSIDSETFLRSFAPALGDAAILQLLNALDAKVAPSLTFAAGSDAASVSMILHDTAGTLLVPLSISVVDATGKATLQTLSPDQTLVVSVPEGGYLALDESDVHPYWPGQFQLDGAQYLSNVAAHFAPETQAALAAFESRSAAQQERALLELGLPGINSANFSDFYAELDSTLARQSAEFLACKQLQTAPTTEARGWLDALAPILRAPAVPSFDASYAACGPALAQSLFWDEFSELADKLDVSGVARFVYLMSYDYGPERSFAVIAPIATSFPSNALRAQAITRLSYQAEASFGYTAVPTELRSSWQEFFRGRIADTTTQTRFMTVWRGIQSLSDASALVLAAPKLHSLPLSAANQYRIVCDARRISSQLPQTWTDFQAAAQPWASLAPEAQAALADPSTCPAARELTPHVARSLARSQPRSFENYDE